MSEGWTSLQAWATPAPARVRPGGAPGGAGSKKFQKGPANSGWAEFLHPGRGWQVPFLRGEPACGGWDQGSSPAGGTVQPSSPARPACGWLQQPRPVLALPGLLALRIPTATHLAVRKKMHRLHLASRWDCAPVYFQGTWRCEAPSWATSCLLYPQQQQTRGFRRAFPRPLSTRSLPQSQSQASPPGSQASSLFASSATCYIPSRPSSPISPFWHFVTTTRPTEPRQSIHPLFLSLLPPALERLPCAHSLDPSSNQATLVRPVKVYPRVTKSSLHPCRRHLEAKRLPPPHLSARLHHPPSWSRITPTCSKRSRRRPPSRDHFFPKNPDFFPAQTLNCLPSTSWQNSMLLRQTTSQLTAHIHDQTWLLPKLTEEAFRWRTRASAW